MVDFRKPGHILLRVTHYFEMIEFDIDCICNPVLLYCSVGGQVTFGEALSPFTPLSMIIISIA